MRLILVYDERWHSWRDDEAAEGAADAPGIYGHETLGVPPFRSRLADLPAAEWLRQTADTTIGDCPGATELRATNTAAPVLKKKLA